MSNMPAGWRVLDAGPNKIQVTFRDPTDEEQRITADDLSADEADALAEELRAAAERARKAGA